MKTPPHERLFSHQPLFQLACVFIVGIILATYVPVNISYLLVGLALTTILTTVGLCIDRLFLARVALLIGAFFAAACLTLLERRSSPNQLKQLLQEGTVRSEESVELTGTVAGPVEFGRGRLYLTVHVERLKKVGNSVNCTGTVELQAWFKHAEQEKNYRQLNLQSGSLVSVATKFDRVEQFRNPGLNTLTDYLATRDVDAVAMLRGPESIIRIETPTSFSLARALYKWRGFLQSQIDSHFSPETAAVLGAALLSNRHNLSYATAERFREGGTFHVLVISGAHISFIGGLVLLFVRRLTVRRWLQFGSATVMVWCYSFAVGAETSVVRAALMFSFLAFGGLLFRRASPLNSLGAAALVLLVWSPRDIFDAAFQLTFLSVLAIVGFALPVLRALSEIGKWRPSRNSPYPPTHSALRSFAEGVYWSEKTWQKELQKLSHSYRLFKSPVSLWLEKNHLQLVVRYAFAAIVVSITVQIVLLPVQIVYFHRLSWSSIVLTLVVGILLAVLAASALVALVMSQISSSLAAPFIKLADALDWLMIHSVDPFSAFGLASMRLPEYSDWARPIYGLYYIPLVLLAVALSRWQPLEIRIVNPGFRKKIKVLICLQLLMCLLLLWHPQSARVQPGRLELSFLDVGQGDSALLIMPDGTTVLIDGGGRPVFGSNERPSQRTIGERVVCEYLWSRGFNAIDYVVATHADADHMDGLNDVARNFSVRGAIVGRTPHADSTYHTFLNTLKTRQTPIQIVQSGDVLRFGEVEIDVLWPRAAIAGAPSRNNDSVVLRVRLGERQFLLTGDIEASAEELLSKPEQVRADVVKVPHHGSNSSSTEAFVSAVGPSLAIISVGRTSMFGHPHKEVIERWQAIGAEVVTTGRSGTITVTTDGKDLSVSRFVRE